ncbi:nicotinamide riboside transporter PnuC [Cellulomonas fimi]|uniref:Nicotinamide mononucleotide transporter PnuC n=1 Tax=Cellulomonas fimi (strain ATCC 484 / DSM 20113 / JCM 1341 / CCUG 24087 / LMG 16345 / NBRC 15513 / NCIMB 8980 / NCTC 7547 / NRS-133) TaxID=590998 RepID=F4H6H6_CELFA|nr:nicotinamide riboside transporter PnuC [Cellulomonas fimi]AEE45609.1 nicotinamide mononucleotide transporter PnuC [Cellulomonas fimi ATCC 484]NNH05883.1 nicotinamide mononucleotide transporter [Cellulomonas fimi]VEH30055.1 Nicotinamide riboside transporter pnuC [Cellulomonas fimi]
MSWVEVLGFVSGAVCVWLATRQNIWNFPVGIANNLLFVWLFATTGLYANAGLQVVYVVLAVLGWVWWVRGGADHGTLAVSRTPRWVWPAGAVAIVAGTAGLTALLSATAGSAAPFWDALTTSSSLVAQLMLGRKWVGSWAVWIATDVVLVGLYASQGLVLTAVLYAGFIVLCVVGWRDWRRALAPSPEPEREPAAVPA